jgi:hypothetical protein
LNKDVSTIHEHVCRGMEVIGGELETANN